MAYKSSLKSLSSLSEKRENFSTLALGDEIAMPTQPRQINCEISSGLLRNICSIYKFTGLLSSAVDGLSEYMKERFLSESRESRIRHLLMIISRTLPSSLESFVV